MSPDGGGAGRGAGPAVTGGCIDSAARLGRRHSAPSICSSPDPLSGVRPEEWFTFLDFAGGRDLGRRRCRGVGFPLAVKLIRGINTGCRDLEGRPEGRVLH